MVIQNGEIGPIHEKLQNYFYEDIVSKREVIVTEVRLYTYKTLQLLAKIFNLFSTSCPKIMQKKKLKRNSFLIFE